MDFKLRQGATERPHQQAHVLYVLEGFRVGFTLPDGAEALRETQAGTFSAVLRSLPRRRTSILIELENLDACPRKR